MGGSDASYRFSALLLAQSADEAQAWEELETYLNPSGAGSIKAAVEEGTTVRAGSADWFRVGTGDRSRAGHLQPGCLLGHHFSDPVLLRRVTTGG